MVSNHEVADYSEALIFKVKWPRMRPHYTHNVTNISKIMAYIMNESGEDFYQGDCLYKPTNAIQQTPKHSWTSDRPQKQASENVAKAVNFQ